MYVLYLFVPFRIFRIVAYLIVSFLHVCVCAVCFCIVSSCVCVGVLFVFVSFLHVCVCVLFFFFAGAFRLLREALCGGYGNAFTSSLLNPMDVMKTRMQAERLYGGRGGAGFSGQKYSLLSAFSLPLFRRRGRG